MRDRSWPLACELAFALGAALAIAPLATLGRSFAILPARTPHDPGSG